MDDFVKTLYLSEVENQAANAQLAAEALNDALAGAGGVREIYAAVQSLLGAAAMISKLLWPGHPGENPKPWRPLTDERSAWLRDVFDVDESSPLHKRTVRNGLEHFDERIDEWVHQQTESGGRFNFVDQYVGPAGGIVIDDEPAPTMRHIDPTVEGVKAAVLGEDVVLQPLLNEVQRVGRLAASERERIRGR